MNTTNIIAALTFGFVVGAGAVENIQPAVELRADQSVAGKPVNVELANGRILKLIMPAENFGKTWDDIKGDLPAAALVTTLPEDASDLQVMRDLYAQGKTLQRAYFPFYNQALGLPDGPVQSQRVVDEILNQAAEGKLGEGRQKIAETMEAISYWTIMLEETMVSEGVSGQEVGGAMLSSASQIEEYRKLEGRPYDGDFFKSFVKELEKAR